MLAQDQLPTSRQAQVVFECTALVLQRPELETVIGQREEMTWVCAITRTVHQYMTSSE